VQIHYSCLINGNNIDPAEFYNFQKFLDDIDEKNLQEVVLTKKLK